MGNGSGWLASPFKRYHLQSCCHHMHSYVLRRTPSPHQITISSRLFNFMVALQGRKAMSQTEHNPHQDLVKNGCRGRRPCLIKCPLKKTLSSSRSPYSREGRPWATARRSISIEKEVSNLFLAHHSPKSNQYSITSNTIFRDDPASYHESSSTRAIY